jgi:hypothetical protein
VSPKISKKNIGCQKEQHFMKRRFFILIIIGFLLDRKSKYVQNNLCNLRNHKIFDNTNHYLDQGSAFFALFFYGMALFIVGGDFFVKKIIRETTEIKVFFSSLIKLSMKFGSL